MELLSRINDERAKYKTEGEGDPTAKFDLSKLGPTHDLPDIKNKAAEILDKNIDLSKYQKMLYRHRGELQAEYDEQKKKIELDEIKKNKAKKRNEQLTKDQLGVLIDSKIDSELIKAMKNTENEIKICEIVSKNHATASQQLQNYNISDTTWRKYLHSDKTL